jgi:hypothetical protein
MTRYLKISRAFHLGEGIGRAFSGPVVASAEAFYLVPQDNAMRSGFIHGGGPLGALVADFIERRRGPIDLGRDVVVTELPDLPLAVTGDPDWPIRADEGAVLVVPRPAVKSMRYSFWKWGIYVCTTALDIRIEPPFFGRKKVFAFLREAGWDVENMP